MTVTTNKHGLTRLRNALKQDIAYSARQKVADNIIREMRENWSGIYPPASSPGEPPAVRTGTLDKSLKRKDNRAQKLVEIWGVYYWYFLEFGHESKGMFVAARPFVRPAVASTKRENIELAKREILREIKRALS